MSVKFKPLEYDEFLKNAKPCNLFEKVQRDLDIAWNKGIYSRDYLINTLGYTAKEIDSVEAYNHKRDQERNNEVANLMHQVVGHIIS